MHRERDKAEPAGDARARDALARRRRWIGLDPAVEPVDARLVSLMRVILAASALAVIYIDPAEPDRLVPHTYTALGLYAAYSLLLYLLSARRPALLPVRYVHWVDAAWYLVFISLSSGTNSIFFIYLFFAILVASFRLGFAHGLAVTLVSASSFTLIGYLTTPAELFDWNRFLLRPVSMLVLGYMFAYWGGLELTFMRRLAFLKEVNRLSNPRFGVDQTIASLMNRLLAFYDADSCLLLVPAENSRDYFVRRAERRRPDTALRAERVPAEAVGPLVSLPDDQAVVFNRARRAWPLSARQHAFSVSGAKNAPAGGAQSVQAAEGLADLLGGSYLSLPFSTRAPKGGRCYLVSAGKSFDASDVDFLRQVAEQVQPVIANVQLLDNLASEAAEQERQKISRDMHDSAIQPYIGLKLGLEALRRRADPDNPLFEDIDELIEMAAEGVADLRRYVGGLKDGGKGQENVLLPAVRRQAAKFTEFYGVRVEVAAETEVSVSDRLAAEAFQIVREGLSNIRRHTSARSATVSLNCSDGELIVRIEDDGATRSAEPASFVPRSITERAEALGGTALAEQRDGHTTVSVVIPL